MGRQVPSWFPMGSLVVELEELEKLEELDELLCEVDEVAVLDVSVSDGDSVLVARVALVDPVVTVGEGLDVLGE